MVDKMYIQGNWDAYKRIVKVEEYEERVKCLDDKEQVYVLNKKQITQLLSNQRGELEHKIYEDLKRRMP